jgi:hypothetical protein
LRPPEGPAAQRVKEIELAHENAGNIARAWPNGFVRTLEDAKAEFAASWGAWLKAAGLNEDTPTAQLKNPESG